MILDLITNMNDFLWNKIVLWFLLLAGLFFTLYLRFVQVRFLKQSIVALLGSNKTGIKQISSFQALCTSLAQRVGTGNLAGVATAITYGGQGAIFWMWITAILGASTSFAECTLAQVFKVKRKDGSFYGGPAYYIHIGLGSKTIAAIFSVFMIVAFGFVFNGVQSNTIAQGLLSAFSLNPLICGILLALGASVIIFGGQQKIAQIAAKLVPFMALFYLSLTLIVMLSHYHEIPLLIGNIIDDAFSSEALVGGLVGHSIKDAFRYGVARGLFSNEAGWGSAPNAAASAAVDHPVQQGIVQMLAVYIDTLFICTSTAFLILLAPGIDMNASGIVLTQNAALIHFGTFGHFFIAIAIIFFGFTTILGNTFYGESNIRFMSNKKIYITLYRISVLLVVIFGALAQVPLIWQMADFISAFMAIINLSSIILLAGIIKKTAQHFAEQFLINNDNFSLSVIDIHDKSSYDLAYDDH
ncbi:MAG: sodium:alanine symporter family protein [Myxococcales bacterium]|nr:sodium:alanine symporter family protein [Myxococcales bacterium]USN51497.1 MAG: sodium:alanine symporter family protein [Myxococcales bacterium]